MRTQSNHEIFKQKLRESERGVWIAAKWLSSRGNWVTKPPLTIAEVHEDWENHTDDGDLFLTNAATGLKHARFEIKQLGCEFTSAGNWPFPDFIVCGKGAHDRTNPKPEAYVILNRSGTHAAVVSTETQGKWWVDTRSTKVYKDHKTEYYLTTPNTAIYFDMREDHG